MTSVKEKIKKLLEMTQANGATEAEAAVAMEKAQKLLADHNLSEAEILGVKIDNNYREQGDFLAFAWAKNIAESVGMLYDCRYHTRRSEKKNHFSSVFIGRQGNAETAKLITEFVVKTVLKLSRQAQKEAGADNRFATDFQHGCAARVSETALKLWREANKEQIEQETRAAREKAEHRKSMQPNERDPKPGLYRLVLLNQHYLPKSEEQLDEKAVFKRMTQIGCNPPRGVYYMALQCVEGELKSNYVYYYNVQALPASRRGSLGGRELVKNNEVYNMGREAGQNIGLRIQMGGNPDANKLT